MIDAEGYRLNVGIMVANSRRELLMGRRIRRSSWQFPQGGIDPGESPVEALWREIWEEFGLTRTQLRLLGKTSGWLHYRLPQRFLRSGTPRCVGQKQKWFLLQLRDENVRPRFDRGPRQEFDGARWMAPERCVSAVVAFKRDVYRSALNELMPLLVRQQDVPPRLVPHPEVVRLCRIEAAR